MIPALMNSAALKVAWLRIWNSAASTAMGLPMPSSTVIRPRWLTVEKARMPLRSVLTGAPGAAEHGGHVPPGDHSGPQIAAGAVRRRACPLGETRADHGCGVQGGGERGRGGAGAGRT